jgi:hypothetical protein
VLNMIPKALSSLTLTDARQALTRLAREDGELTEIRARFLSRQVEARQQAQRDRFWRSVQSTRAIDAAWAALQRKRG